MPIKIEAATSSSAHVTRPGNVDSPHAEIVHAGNAAADDGAADRRRRARRRDRPRPPRPAVVTLAAATNESAVRSDVIGDRHARLVGQHGDEMRRPDAEAGREAGSPPSRSRVPAER